MTSKTFSIIKKELKRQQTTLDLIPSENIASPAILRALGSVFTNRYAEGYPGRRYYPGNNFSDELELYAQKLVKKVFKLDDTYAVNVQPYSGSPANLAVYLALLAVGDPLMGLDLASGGHLTHGHKASVTGKLFTPVRYFVNPQSGLIEYDAVRDIALRFKPKIIVSGATAYPRRIDFKKFHDIAKEAGAYSMADISHIAGLVAASVHPSPFPFTDVVMFTTHKTLRGPRAAIIVAKKELAEKIDKIVFPGMQGGPHLNAIAAIAVALEEAAKHSFITYQRHIVKNAAVLANTLQKLGHTLVSGGTDTHLMLLDMRQKNIPGKIAEEALESVGIIANRNTVPGDLTPFNPSGVRMGTPSVTSRGMREREMHAIAGFIHEAIIKKRPLGRIKKDVKRLCKKFPLSYKRA